MVMLDHTVSRDHNADNASEVYMMVRYLPFEEILWLLWQHLIVSWRYMLIYVAVHSRMAKKYRAWRLCVVNNIEQSSLKEKLVEIINLTLLRSRQSY